MRWHHSFVRIDGVAFVVYWSYEADELDYCVWLLPE